MIEFQKTTNIRQSALRWWNKLSASQKRTYEHETYGYGEWWEDNTLTDGDFEHMYKKYVLKTK